MVLAVATGCGLYGFLRYREARLACAASLTFDSAEAQELDPRITRGLDPAVLLSQTILSDAVVTKLVPEADLVESPTALAIGEFRTRVELTEPTAGLLLVRYRDSDPGQAAATANAVAKVLAAWAPSTTSAPPPAAANAQPAPAPGPEPAPASAGNPAPAPGPNPAPASAAAPQHAPVAEPSLAVALGELHAQLSAADHRVGPDSPLRSEHDRQRYLESQVRIAEQKLDDLRSKFAHSGSASGGQARVVAIQHAMALFWPSAAGLNTAGTSKAQFSYEREQLSRDIGIVEQQRQAAQREEVANSAPANPPAQQTRASQQTAPTPPQPQLAPADAAPSPTGSGATPNPLHLERLAALPGQVDWWPSALAGCFCGLLYWGLAFARNRYYSEDDDSEDDDLRDPLEESSHSTYRLFDTDEPVAAGSRGEPDDAYPVETPSRKRASFIFDLDSVSASAPDQSPSPEPMQDSTADAVLHGPPKTAVAPNHTDLAHTDLAETASAADAAAPLSAPNEHDEALHGTIVGTADPWGDEIRKNLSQTNIGRVLVTAEESPAKGPARDELPRPSQSDCLPG